MSPNEYRKVIGTSDKAFIGLINERILLLLVLIAIAGGVSTHPLHIRDTFEVTEVVADDSVFWRSLSAINDHKTGIGVLNLDESEVIC
jgi:hypothetical protein